MQKKKVVALLLTAALMVGCSSGGSTAQESSTAASEPAQSTAANLPEGYPDKPITMICPWGAGGGSDILCRILAQGGEKYLGQPIEVVNRDGAGGVIATTEFLKEKGDGYTILFEGSPVFVSQPKLNEVSYSEDDFRSIIATTEDPIVLTTHKNSPFKTLDEMLEYGKENTIKYGNTGAGGLLDVAQKALYEQIGVQYTGITLSGGEAKTEHNLYPVRYQKAIYDITKEMRGEGLIWARAGWAGAQRYPVHWGGDSESTNGGLAASIRGGISLGASGFTYWSHDIGGFCKTCPEELYLRWLAFGAFSSHARCHGQTPKEPWTMSPAGQEMFRKIVEARYKLLPYIYTQAAIASERGLPLLRGMFIDYPEDPLAWTVEDAYLFGDDMLVAPLLSDSNTRNVYLPRGEWVDYQTGIDYDGGKMYSIQTTNLPILLFVKKTAAIPLSPVVQCTEELDWSKVYFQTFSDDKKAEGRVLLPDGSFQAYKTC